MSTKQTGLSQPINIALIDAIIYKQNVNPGALISILQEIQEVYGYVPRPAIVRVAEATHTSAADIFGIVTFYTQFRLQPQGRHVIKVCHGTACHLNGAEKIADSLCKCIGAKEGETSPDGQYSVEKVACLGCCSLAPTIMIDNETYGRLSPDSINSTIKEFENTQPIASPE